MCLKEEPEMNALLHVPASCLDDVAAPHGFQPREVCLSSDVVFSCEQNCWQYKDCGKGHTLKDRKGALQALCVIQSILVLMPLYNQQKVKNNKDKQTVFPSVSLKHPDNWFSQFFSHCIDQLLWLRADTLQKCSCETAAIRPPPPKL